MSINAFVKTAFLYRIYTTKTVRLNKLRLNPNWADVAVVLTVGVYVRDWNLTGWNLTTVLNMLAEDSRSFVFILATGKKYATTILILSIQLTQGSYPRHSRFFKA